MLKKELEQLKNENRIIRIGLVGAGQMGEGLVCQCEQIGNLQVVAIYSRNRERCEQAYQSAGIAPEKLRYCESAEAAERALQTGFRVIAQSLEILCAIEQLDLVVEATGIPEVGAQTSIAAISNRHHILQMNVETDATVGYLLALKAKEQGVIYTLSSGDEPGAIMELYDFARTLNFPVTCVGKGKNNPVDRRATALDPAIQKKAQKFRMNPDMLAAFVDGSKTMIEMCSLGNAIGFTPEKRGMSGYTVTPDQIAATFCPKEYGGMLEREQVLEYAHGIAPGVFVVIRVDHPKLLLDFQYLAMGSGPYYALYRPYHLVSLEAPISILRCMFYGQATLASEHPPVNEVLTIAKEDLAPGQQLEGLGGASHYGLIETRSVSRQENFLPIGLASHARVKRRIPSGEVIRYEDVELEEESVLVQLRREQDKLSQ